jgi:group II intron reverse transcriptase/maturase
MYDITPEEVDEAWKLTRQSGGGCGHDGQTIKDVAEDLKGQCYKVWNRLSSGSYIPQPVLLVNIPKAKGGYRQLGIPTVTDRIAQNVIKKRLDKAVQRHFHVDSYAYQNGKGAIDALAVTRQRCFHHEWLLEVDIKAFFDELDHDLMMEMVEKYVTDKATLLYVRKFLKAPGRTEDGEEILREKGTPQGGVVSPVLANLYLHEAFDSWMQESFPGIKWARYADDFVVHCISEKQAHFIKDKIAMRLQQFKLSLHPEKTRVVYTGTKNIHDHRGHDVPRKFTFLGYDFKPRHYKGRLVFVPAIGAGALKMARKKIIEPWESIARDANDFIRGWIGYFGHFRPSELHKLARLIDWHLVAFIKRKYKSRSTWNQSWKALKDLKVQMPKLFYHWHTIRGYALGRAV